MEFILQLMVAAYVVGAVAALVGGASVWAQRVTALGATAGAAATLALGGANTACVAAGSVTTTSKNSGPISALRHSPTV